MTEAVIAGHRTAWRVFGHGPRPALALHCSLAHAGAWAAVGERLGDLLTMTAVDMPGHGRTADWDGETDLHRLSTDIAAHFAAQGPVDLIGHSFGGTVALRLALERPERVRSLTLIEPVLFAAAHRADPAHYAADTAQAPFAQAWREGRREDAAALFHAEWGNGIALDALPERQRRYIVDRMGLIVAQDPYLAQDSAGLLRPGGLESLPMPVLLAEGGASPPVIGAIMGELARRIPDARRLVVPGAGHMLPITHSAAVAAGLRAMLAEPT